MDYILMTYKDELTKAMGTLAKDDRVIFLGQSVDYETFIYYTLLDTPKERRIEMPIAEEMQMGISIGFALDGYIPVSIYPRMDFLILAMNQLVNHLDRFEEMSRGEFKPKVIIRCLVGSTKPLYPGLQHSQDHTEMLRRCLTNIKVVKFNKKEDIVPSYIEALTSDKSTLLIEERNLYDT